jgi:inosine-uridine nucleoside N-ribohydrolase
MKSITLFLSLLIILSGCSQKTVSERHPPVRIIFDTDLGSDYDDVGALAFLHAAADSGKAEILATVASNRYELTAPAIDVINTYFGRPELPLGSPKTGGTSSISPYHWADTLVERYPHSIRSTSEAPDAVEIYRRVLCDQPDSSVTIITVGYLTNLANLLKSGPDGNSTLTGSELVSLKVNKLVVMGGIFPEGGRSFNIFMDSLSSEYVFRNWKGTVIFTGDDIGERIKTGLELIRSGIRESPVKDAYRISMSLSDEDKQGRMSWDQTAVIIGIYGTDGFFGTVRGKITVRSDGSNEWENDPDGMHYYVTQKLPPDKMAEFIEAGMMHVPYRLTDSRYSGDKEN